jgi:hypothetical protein
MRDDELVKALEAYAQARAEMRPSPINVMLPKSDMPLSTLDKLDSLCTRHQVFTTVNSIQLSVHLLENCTSIACQLASPIIGHFNAHGVLSLMTCIVALVDD